MQIYIFTVLTLISKIKLQTEEDIITLKLATGCNRGITAGIIIWEIRNMERTNYEYFLYLFSPT